jgi:hypothetical protein
LRSSRLCVFALIPFRAWLGLVDQLFERTLGVMQT